MYRIIYWDTEFVEDFHKQLAFFLSKHPTYQIQHILNDRTGYMIIFNDALADLRAFFGEEDE